MTAEPLLRAPKPDVMRGWSDDELLDFRARAQQQMGALDELLVRYAPRAGEFASARRLSWWRRTTWAAARTAGTLAMVRSEVRRRRRLLRDANLRPVYHLALLWWLARRQVDEHHADCATGGCEGCRLLGQRLTLAEIHLAGALSDVAAQDRFGSAR